MAGYDWLWLSLDDMASKTAGQAHLSAAAATDSALRWSARPAMMRKPPKSDSRYCGGRHTKQHERNNGTDYMDI